MSAKPPLDAKPWSDIHRDIEEKIMPGLNHWSSPHFMAFFPAPSTFPGILGELYSAAFTVPAFNWACSPVHTELETIVLDWLADMLNLPSCYSSTGGTGGGVIQGSASEAVLTCMVAARERWIRRQCAGLDHKERVLKAAELKGTLVALASDQAHSSVQKAALIAGVHYRSVETSIGNDLSMRGEDLRKCLVACRNEGLQPFFINATFGTTSTCAVDDIEGVAKIVQEKEWSNAWVHVDAAYAGSALICEEYQGMTEHLDKFDSLDLSVSKWLPVNLDAKYVQSKHPRRFKGTS